jgi:DNA polymerase-3 subunit delta'
MISGAEGRGQWALAQHVAKAFMCEHHEKPCGFCPSCNAFDSGTHPDVWMLKDEDNETISIDMARLLDEHTHQKPMRIDGCRLVLIEHFDRATTAAQQSLLKTFEEPFVKTAIVLTSRNAERVIPTIRSRLSVINVAPVSRIEFKSWCDMNRIEHQDWLYDLTDGSPLLLKNLDLNKMNALRSAVENGDPNILALAKTFNRDVLFSIVYHVLANRAQDSLDIKDFQRLDQWQALYQEAGMSKAMNWDLSVRSILL